LIGKFYKYIGIFYICIFKQIKIFIFSPEIDYQENALTPILTTETVKFHFGKHHTGYCNTINSLIKNTEYENLSLTEIIVKSRNNDGKIFNNASQLFNHNFYWKGLKVNGEATKEKLKILIEEQFVDFDSFLHKYIDCAGTLFGSGWS
jgi:Fe-Mn family superoxide dismutase